MRAYRALSVLAGALLATALTACAVVDTVDPRYDTINRASEKARNESILLNIARASENSPLNFIAFSKVGGTFSMNGGAAAPQFLLGPLGVTSMALNAAGAITGSTRSINSQIGRDVTVSNTTLNASTQVLNNFDITLLETKDFYAGLLAPVDLPTINFFVRQGYSRELLFWLFTASARETIHGRTYEYRNDPDPAISCETVAGKPRCFKDMVDIAMASGLAVQIQTTKGTGKGSILGRLCFDPVLERRARRDFPPEVIASLRSPSASHQPRCDTDKWEHEKPGAKEGGETDTLTFEVRGTPVGSIQYTITTRSIFGIYQFLGRLLATGTDIRLQDRALSEEESHLLAINGDSSGGCFVSVGYDGTFYCVPRRGADTTKKIFSLLAQLIALRTQSQDLAITPTVRTIQ